MIYYTYGETIEQKAALLSERKRHFKPFVTDKVYITDFYTKEGGAMYITYPDLIQTGIFIVTLVNLCYKIFRDRRK